MVQSSRNGNNVELKEEDFMNIKLQQRDIDIIEFIKRVTVADTTTLYKIFFSRSCGLRTCQERLTKLVNAKRIKRFRESTFDEYIYYINKKPSSYLHKIVFSRLIAKLKEENIEIIKYKTPLKFFNIIADGFIVYKDNGLKMAFVEIERTKYFDEDKYNKLYYSREWKKYFSEFPDIWIITDKNIKNTNKRLRLKVFKLDLSDLNV